MNIILAAPVHKEIDFLKQKGKYHFLKGQGQQSWIEAFEKLGHRVYIFRYTDSILIPQILRVYIKEIFQRLIPLWKARYDRFKSKFYFFSLDNYLKNKRLISLVRKVKPQLIIISGGVTSIYPKTMQKIKNLFGCKILLFSGVNPQTSSTINEKIMIKKGIIDIVVENDRGYAYLWKKFGVKKTVVLPISSIDPNLHKKIKLSDSDKEKYGCDVCFVGTLTLDRQRKLTRLINFNLKIWGEILPLVGLNNKLKPFYFGKASGEKMVRIFNATKIVLNFQPKDMKSGGNMRTFEIPGCGAFQLADKVDEKFFKNGKEIVLFNDIKDLKRKIAYYLNNDVERIKIANEGYRKTHRYHTYEKHFKKILS